MRKSLRRFAAVFYIVGTALVFVVFISGVQASALAAEEDQAKVFWLTLLWGLAIVLPYFGFGAILTALAVLVPAADTRPVARQPVALESPGVTVDEVLGGPGSAALKRRILQDLLTVGDITRAQYDGALADPRLTGAPTR